MMRTGARGGRSAEDARLYPAWLACAFPARLLRLHRVVRKRVRCGGRVSRPEAPRASRQTRGDEALRPGGDTAPCSPFSARETVTAVPVPPRRGGFGGRRRRRPTRGRLFNRANRRRGRDRVVAGVARGRPRRTSRPTRSIGPTSPGPRVTRERASGRAGGGASTSGRTNRCAAITTRRGATASWRGSRGAGCSKGPRTARIGGRYGGTRTTTRWRRRGFGARGRCRRLGAGARVGTCGEADGEHGDRRRGVGVEASAVQPGVLRRALDEEELKSRRTTARATDHAT